MDKANYRSRGFTAYPENTTLSSSKFSVVKSIKDNSRRLAKLTIDDVLSLIPDYSGIDVCEFVHFKKGCNEALEVIGSKYERTLLKFLKLKLKSTAYARFSLHVADYKSLSKFIKEMERSHPDLHCFDMWEYDIMRNLYQEKREPITDYAARFEDAFECAVFTLCNDDKNDTNNEEMVSKLNGRAIHYFMRNLVSERMVWLLYDKYKKVDTLQQMIEIALDDWTYISDKPSRCKACFSHDHDEQDCDSMIRDYDFTIRVAEIARSRPSDKQNNSNNNNNEHQKTKEQW